MVMGPFEAGSSWNSQPFLLYNKLRVKSLLLAVILTKDIPKEVGIIYKLQEFAELITDQPVFDVQIATANNNGKGAALRGTLVSLA